MTLLVRDEADVLEANLRHHLAQGVDHVIAYDHGSRDGTGEILAGFEREGLLTWRTLDDPGYHQDRWVTEMARAAAREHDADWVINADADEFFMPAAGTLVELLAALPDEVGKVVVPRNDLVPRPEGSAPFWDRLTVRETSSRSPLGFPLLPKVIHRGDPEVVVAMGNHDVLGDAFTPLPPLGLIEIVHAPMRSWEQVARRTRNIGEALQASTLDASELADHRHLYELLLNEELRAWFDERVVGDEAVRAGLASGRLVEDRRIPDSLAGRAVAPSGPGAARVVVDERVDVMREWLVAYAAGVRAPLESRIRTLDAHLAAATARLETYQRDQDILVADIATSRAEADELRDRLRKVEALPVVRAARRAQAAVRRAKR